jgi:hypothetical protein
MIKASGFVLLLSTYVGQAATYYVATYGSDTNNGLSTNTPFATPHKAVTAALAPSDTIFIRGWTNGSFKLVVNGLTAHGPVVIHSTSDFLTWSPIHTSAPVVGAVELLDTNSTNHPRRFYRAEKL